MAIALPTMRRPGAAIAMALGIVMVPWGGSATTTIAMTMTTTPTMTTTKMAQNSVGEVAGERGGRAGAHGGGRIRAQIKKRQ